MKKILFLFTFLIILPTTILGDDFSNIKINVQIETHQGNIFNDEIEITSCYDNKDGETKSINIFCAIEKIADQKKWEIKKTWYSFGASLDGLSNYEVDYINNRFWLYFINEEPGAVAMNSYILKNGDKLLLAYGTSPLLIESSNPNPSENSITTISAKYFDVINWTWQPTDKLIFVINNQEKESEKNGLLELFVENNTTYKIYAKAPGFINSKTISISSQKKDNVITPGGVWIPPVPPKDFSIGDAIAFVANQIEENNFFGADIYNDWVAIALGSFKGQFNIITDKLKQYLEKNPIRENSYLTDYERRVMALMAIGKNPWNENGINYIKKILNAYDGKQFGDPNLFNDDIFAIIPLIKSGISIEDQRLISAGNFISQFQNKDGSFGGPDLTAASIQALLLLKPSEKFTNIINKAREYLQKSQNIDGGWGNSFSTSWVIQAIYAMNEKPENWTKNDRNPLNFIGSHQAEDGGMEWSKNKKSRLWATSYAISAMSKKPWSEILVYFPSEEKKKNEDSKQFSSIKNKKDVSNKFRFCPVPHSKNPIKTP